MKTWMVVLLVIVGIYALGAIGMGVYMRNFRLGLLWPMTVLWMLFGNIQ